MKLHTAMATGNESGASVLRLHPGNRVACGDPPPSSTDNERRRPASDWPDGVWRKRDICPRTDYDGPRPTKVGHSPQPSTTVSGTVIACPVVAGRTVKL